MHSREGRIGVCANCPKPYVPNRSVGTGSEITCYKLELNPFIRKSDILLGDLRAGSGRLHTLKPAQWDPAIVEFARRIRRYRTPDLEHFRVSAVPAVIRMLARIVFQTTEFDRSA